MKRDVFRRRTLVDPSTGPDTDRMLADWLAEEAPVHEPPVLLPSTLARTALTRRRPGWRVRDRWLWPSAGRSTGVWRIQRMSISLTALALATGASLLLLSSVDRDGLPDLLGAGTGDTFVVDHDGAGDFESIIAAVREAQDGDTIVLRAGRYPEWVRVPDKDVTIVGDGERGDVIVESGYDNTFYVSDSALTLSNLTVIAQEYGFAIDAAGEGSSVTLDGVDLQVRGSWCCEHSPLRLSDGATGSLRGSSVEGKVEILSGSTATIEDSVLTSACVEVGLGATATVRGSTITGCPLGYAIAVRGGSAVVEGNDLSVPASDVRPASGATEPRTAVVAVAGPDGMVVRDNRIHDSTTAVRVSGAGAVEIDGNDITGNDVGVSASVDLTLGPGNTVCDNGTNISLGPDAESVIDASSEVCPDAPSPEA